MVGGNEDDAVVKGAVVEETVGVFDVSPFSTLEAKTKGRSGKERSVARTFFLLILGHIFRASLAIVEQLGRRIIGEVYYTRNHQRN